MDVVDSDTLKAQLVAIAETTVERVAGKVEKLEGQLADARDALATAEQDLAAARNADPEFVEPTENVRASAT